MNGFLLDTNVISMLSPTKGPAHEDFIDWLAGEDAQGRVFLSVVTLHEIERGIGLLVHKSARSKAAELRQWLSGLMETFEDKILPIDTAVSFLSGQLEAAATASGYSPGTADALIAGTAKRHELSVVTKNLKHFEPFDIEVLAPNDCTKNR